MNSKSRRDLISDDLKLRGAYTLLLKGKWKSEYDIMQMDDVSLQIINGRLMLEDYFRVKVVLEGLIINYLHL